MTTVERDPEFRERLIAYYKEGDFHGADFTIAIAASMPGEHLDTLDHCRKLLLGLELWSAILGHPHSAIEHVPVDRLQWPRQRCVATCDQVVTALFWLSQSRFGPDFADDAHNLRPRLFALAQEEAEIRECVIDSPST